MPWSFPRALGYVDMGGYGTLLTREVRLRMIETNFNGSIESMCVVS